MRARVLLWLLGLALLAACRADRPEVRAQAALAAGTAGLATGDGAGLAEARARFSEARSLAEEAKREDLLILALQGLGQVADRIGHQRNRRASWSELLEHPLPLDLELHARLSLADALETMGDHAGAAQLLAEVAARAPQDSLHAARVALIEGLIATHVDKHQQAIRELRAAIPRFEALGQPKLAAEAWSTIASAEARLGDWDQAWESGERALDAARRSKDGGVEGNALNRKALYTINHQQKFAEGIEIYDEAIRRFEASGHLDGLAYALDGSAVAMSTLDRREGTVERHLRALAIRRELGSARGEAQTLTSLGETYTRFGRYDEAADALDQALVLHTRQGDLFFQVYTLFRRARVEESRGRFTDAVRFVERAIALDESLRSRLASRDKRTFFVSSPQTRWRYDLFVNSSVQSELQEKRPGGILRALAMSEATRARSFREAMAATETSTRAAHPELAAIEAKVAELEQARLRLVIRDAPLAELDAVDQRMAAALAEHEAKALTVHGEPRPIDLPLSQEDLRTVGPEVLEPGDVLLEYYLGAGGSYVFVVTTATVAVRALPRVGAVEAPALDLHAALVARNVRPEGEARRAARARIAEADAAVRPKAEALSKLLLDPVAPWLADARRVVVVADGALQRVPFAALVRPGTGGWLGLELEVVESPSIAVLRALRGRARPAPQGAVVLADPVFSAQDPRLPPGTVAPTGERFLARLPFTRQEAEAIAARLPPGEAETRLDFAANRAAVLSGALAGRRLIHFATHGILDPTRPELSALVLSRYDAAGHPQDGDLRLGDLKGISLSAELVVLSGCETAIGREFRGEGLISLTRGFLHAGARQVLATLWQVDDRATSQMVAAFYEERLTRGRATGPALLAARRRTAAARPAPYYWAGLTLQGDWKAEP